jgi:hypothetical protein
MGNDLLSLFSAGGYGLSTILSLVVIVLYRQGRTADAQIQTTLREVIPLTVALPSAIEKLHTATERLERLGERTRP